MFFFAVHIVLLFIFAFFFQIIAHLLYSGSLIIELFKAKL